MNFFKATLALVVAGLTPLVGQAKPISTLHTDQNMEKGRRLGENYPDFYFLGFNHQNRALFMLDLVGQSQVYWVDPITAKIVQTRFQGYFDPTSARLTPDGKTILAGPGAWDPGINHPDLMIVDAADTKKIRHLRIGNEHTNVYTALPLSNDRAAISVLESTWDPKLKDYAGDYKKGARYEIWDWKKGRKLGSVKTEGIGASQVFFVGEQNKRCLVSLFQHLKTNDYPAPFSPKGALSFFNTKSGNPDWRVYGNASQTIGYPSAQLTPTQIVSQSTIYEYPAKRIRPLKVQGERVRLLGMVPGHPQKMMVATKRGAELWDYAKQKRLHRWAEIRNVNQLYFSPDLKFFATQKYAQHLYEFYRFNPSWVK